MTQNASKRQIIAATVRSSTCLCCEPECPPYPRRTESGANTLSRMITGTFITVDELQLRSQRKHLLLHTTGMSTTLSKNCNCGIPDLHCLDQNPCLAQQRARQPCPRGGHPRRRSAQQGHRPPRRRKHTQQETQPAAPRPTTTAATQPPPLPPALS